MSKKLKVSTQTTPKELFGSILYTVVVDITNTTTGIIENVSVEPQFLPGNLIIRDQLGQNSLEELQNEKQKLARVMELQVIRAHGHQILQRQVKSNPVKSIWEQFRDTFKRISVSSGSIRIDLYMDNLYEDSPMETFRINSLKDIYILEEDFILHEKEDSEERKIFLASKKKILERMSEIEKKETEKENLKERNSIHPDETISYTFKVRSPLLLRGTTYSLHFKISYKDTDIDRIVQFSEKQEVSFYPSPFSTYIGAFLGGIAGFLVKISLTSSNQISWFTPTFWPALLGSIILALVFCAVTARTPNMKKAITTEDFIGGFILGALVGLFSESILNDVKKLIPQFSVAP